MRWPWESTEREWRLREAERLEDQARREAEGGPFLSVRLQRTDGSWVECVPYEGWFFSPESGSFDAMRVVLAPSVAERVTRLEARATALREEARR